MIKNFFITFLVFLVWSFFGLWIYSWLKDSSDLIFIAEKNNKEFITTTTIDAVRKDSTFMLDTINTIEKDTLSNAKIKVSKNKTVTALDFLENSKFTIIKNDFRVIVPENFSKLTDTIRKHLIENNDKELHITGLYSPDEEMKFPNFGILRAESVKQKLIGLGIEKDKMVIKSMIKPLFTNDTIYYNAIKFTFRDLDVVRLQQATSEVPDNKIIYPRFSTSGIMVNNQLRDVLKEILTFTALKPDLKIKVIGHTDNIGNGVDNYTLGLKYARQVRWYFVTKGGLKKSQVIALSKGESEPIASNKTDRGRKANNRIEIVFE